MLHSSFSIKSIHLYSADYSSLRLLSEKLVVLFLQFWLLIDMVNGYFMLNGISLPGGFSLGELSRILFLISFLISFKVKKNSFNLLLFSLPLLLLSISIYQYIFLNPNLVASINMSIKLCLPIFIFLFIKEVMPQRKKIIIKIIKTNSLILILNLIISLFGFGYFTYYVTGGVNFGGKGFFYAGNEVSIVILVTYSLLIYLYKNKPKTILYITIIYILISLISLTRASILGVSMVFIVSVILYQKKYRNMILSTFFISISAMVYILRDYIMLAINRAFFFIDNTSMLIFMTGGHKRWEATSDYYHSLLDSPLLLFTGSGWTGYSEQDLVDLIAAFGIIGVSIYFIWLYFGAYTYINHEHKSDKIFIFFIFVIIFGIATLAGHVVSSAMLAPFVAILGNLHLLKNTKQFKILNN